MTYFTLRFEKGNARSLIREGSQSGRPKYSIGETLIEERLGLFCFPTVLR
jgi:hypothetical protein